MHGRAKYEPLEERVVRMGVAAVLASLKMSNKATKRCRKRTSRAKARLLSQSTAILAPFDAELAPGAVEWLARGCKICGRCDGI